MFKTISLSFSAFVSAGIMALSLFAGLPVAGAQTNDVRVKVPFAFEADGQQFAPGVYTLRMNVFTRVMVISSDSQTRQFMVLPDATLNPANAGKLVFHRYGTQYFLREIWVENSKTHVHTLQPKAEKQLQLAANAVAHTAGQGEELALTEMPH